MKVSLMHHTPLHIAAFAGHVCTDTEGTASYSNSDVISFLKRLTEAGHESVLEHIVYTFNVEGLSRACLQELARHRHVSLSVKSTRWALKKTLEAKGGAYDDALNMAHNSLPKENSCEDEYLAQVDAAQDMHHALYLLFGALEHGVSVGLPNDFLKYFLPECFTTDLVITLNARELRHIMRLRGQPNVLPEFRALARQFYHVLPLEHSFLFDDVAEVNKTQN